jgi:hypothetical protein
MTWWRAWAGSWLGVVTVPIAGFLLDDKKFYPDMGNPFPNWLQLVIKNSCLCPYQTRAISTQARTGTQLTPAFPHARFKNHLKPHIRRRHPNGAGENLSEACPETTIHCPLINNKVTY